MQKINQETVNFFFNKLAKLFNSFFPGVVILELFFSKGYFSNPPNTLFSFIIYLAWCGILSMPYNFIHPLWITFFFSDCRNEIEKKYNIPGKEIIPETDALRESEEQFQTGLIILNLVITYFVFKTFLFLNLPKAIITAIPIHILQLFITLVITQIINLPLGYIYASIFRLYILAYAKRVIKNKNQ